MKYKIEYNADIITYDLCYYKSEMSIEFAVDDDFIAITAPTCISELEFGFATNIDDLMILNPIKRIANDDFKHESKAIGISIVTICIRNTHTRLLFLNRGRSITHKLTYVKLMTTKNNHMAP